MRFLFFIVSGIILFSCTENAKNPINSVAITPVFTDSLTIRAILPVSTTSAWFAANRGVVGLLVDTIPKLATIKYEEKPLAFRAIAKTSDAVFVLSIESPAVLYKIGYSGNEATHIEEVYKEEGEGVFYDAMTFWNDKEGIAIGDPLDDCLSIIITRDGGSTWQKVSCDSLPSIAKGEAAFAASNSNIATFGNHTWVVTGGMKSRVLYSGDKGRSWQVYTTPIIEGKPMTGIYSVDFYDEKTGIIVGGNWEDKTFNQGNKAITHNGGKSWKLLANGEIPGYLSCVQFVPNSDTRKIVAVSTAGIFVSNNQGKHWKQVSQEGFYSIRFVNDTLAFASGKNKISKLVFK